MRIEANDETGDDGMINLTPLIDVVFLLLIFFMVTAKFQEDERDLAVELPEAENADLLQDLPETLFVSVRRDGTLHVGSREVDREELKRVLTRAKRKNPDQKVIVRADHEVELRHPVVVLDLCAGLGIETSLATADLLAR